VSALDWLPWRRQKAQARDFERFARAFAPPSYFAGTYRVGLTGTAGLPQIERLAREFTGWQAIASVAIGRRLSTLSLEVIERSRDRKGTVVEEVLDDHPLAAVWDANPVFSLEQLLAIVGYWLTHRGEAYLLKVTDSLGLTRELWPLTPERMTAITDRDLGIGAYKFTTEAGEIDYDPDELVRIWWPDPAQPFAALGNLAPQAIAYDAGKFVDETVRSHYEKDAVPKVAMMLKGTPAAPATMPQAGTLARWLADWRMRHTRRGGTEAGLPAVLPPGWEPYEFKSFGGVSENAELMDRWRDRLLMANGVPRSVLGDVVDANRAAADTNAYVFDLHAISPHAGLVAKALTRQLAVLEYGDAIAVRFAEFIARDKDFDLRREGQDLDKKLRTVNQVREDRGLDPVAWGELPIGSFGDTPYTGEEPEPLEPDDPEAFGEVDPAEDGADDEGPRNGGRALAAGVRRAWAPAEVWARQVITERTFAPAFARAMRAVFAQQRDAVLAELDELRARAEARASLDDLLDPETWTGPFRRVVEPVRRRVFRETGDVVLRELGVRDKFQFLGQTEHVLERQGAELVRHVNETTRRRLRAALLEGVDAGEGQDAIARRVRGVFAARRDHARSIARTEVLRAAQSAHLEGFSQSGVVERKQWNTSQDDAVRDSHAETDGQVRDLEAAFMLGDGEAADAPGIGVAGAPLSARNAINCRCFVTPVFSGEEEE